MICLDGKRQREGGCVCFFIHGHGISEHKRGVEEQKKDRRRLDERITGPKLHHRTNPVYSPIVVKKKDRLVFIYRYKHTVNTAERARTIL